MHQALSADTINAFLGLLPRLPLGRLRAPRVKVNSLTLAGAQLPLRAGQTRGSQGLPQPRIEEGVIHSAEPKR